MKSRIWYRLGRWSRSATGRVATLVCTVLIAAAPGSAAPISLAAPVMLPGVDPEGEAWIEATLEEMDLRDRVAQLVLPWIRGGHIPRNTVEFRRIQAWIEEDRVGGLIVSQGPAGEFPPMLNSLQLLSRVPLLIVSDLETGPAMRLTGGTMIPPAMALGAADDHALARDAGRITAIEARAAGIHLTLGPVLDVNSNRSNPIINTRSFGEDPAHVAGIAIAWIEGARSEGLLAAGKHFPGHGATGVDSHVGLPTLAIDRAGLETLDLVPFRRAIESGIDGLLVGHIAVPAIDGHDAPPASMSPGVIRGLLREEMGFDGLVFTDALNMGAVTRNFSVAEASIQALLAGADMLLQPPGERVVIGAIVAAVEEGRIPVERIDEAVRRVLTAKARAGLHVPIALFAQGDRVPSTHGDVAREITAASITLARDRDGLVPLPGGVRRILHVVFARDGTRFSAGEFATVLRGAGVTVETATVNASTRDYQPLLERSRGFDMVIVSANMMPREYRGIDMQDGYSRFVRSLAAAGTTTVAVSFGSPYMIEDFPAVATYLLAWSDGVEAQRAAARALLGQTPIRGRLPISLPPHHTAGEGIIREPVGAR